MFDNVVANSICLINTNKRGKELDELFPVHVKEIIEEKNIKVLLVDADKIAISSGIKGKISKIMELLI